MVRFYYGADSFSIAAALKKLKAEFVGDVVEFVIRGQTDRELKSALQEAFQSQGLFSARKLIILKDFLTEIKKYPETEKYLLDFPAPEGNEIVFAQTENADRRLKFFKTLQKTAEAKEFIVPAGKDLETWVKNYLQGFGFAIEPAALAELVRLLGQSEEERLYDLWQVTSELEKMMLLRFDEKRISLGDVRELVRPNISENIFALTNLFAEGNGAAAASLLEQMLGRTGASELKTEAIQVIGALASQIRSLLLVKDLEGQNPAKIAAQLGWKEGRVWINSKLSKKFSKDKLLAMMRDLRALDLRFKTSEEPPKLLLTLFLQKAKA